MKIKTKKQKTNELIYSIKDFRDFRRFFAERERKRIDKLKSKSYKSETFKRLSHDLSYAKECILELNGKINKLKIQLNKIADDI